MRVDSEDKSLNKDIPVKHHWVDSRALFIRGKIEETFEPEARTNRDYKIPTDEEGFSPYSFSKFMNEINKVYGKDIEKQREVRHIIDATFLKYNWIIKSQFFIFTLGFLVPFIIQLFWLDGIESRGAVIFLNCLCLLT